MKASEKWVRLRIRLVGLGFALVFAVVAVRAFDLQVLHQKQWQKRAERQHQKVIPLTPQRGTIFDRNGEPLALSLEVDSIYLEPQKAPGDEQTARLLAGALDLKPAAVTAKLGSNKSFLWLKRQVAPRESRRVRSFELPGVGFIKEHRRFYPNSELGAQVIGFTGVDPEGLEGLELAYDGQILGQGGYLVVEQDALGRGIGGGKRRVRAAKPGSDLHLTLDKNLQYLAEKELAAGVRKSGARGGTVVVVEPGSGEVLAMASQPDYNPNAFQRYRPSQWRNRALTDTYEPGSTLKMFLLAAALDQGTVRIDDEIDCENGAWRVGGKVIHDHHPYGRLEIPEILKVSSNIGAAKIGKALERENLYRYLRRFGFGAASGIELPGEQPGLLRQPDQWFEIDLAAISFGQGLTVTPLQMAMATAAIANGGYLMKPYVVREVRNAYGEPVERHGPQARRQAVSGRVARLIREMMVEVTQEGGTGTLASVPGYPVAGKTGTAQKVDPVTGTYSMDKMVASFVGFVPASDPRLVILVLLDEPQGQSFGGLVAAPVFSRIAEQALRYYKVPPQKPIRRQKNPPRVADVTALRGSHNRPNQITATPETDDPGALRMPDCRGMSYRQVLRAMESSGLNVRLLGSGRVVEQSPEPGQTIEFGSEVRVRLAPPA